METLLVSHSLIDCENQLAGWACTMDILIENDITILQLKETKDILNKFAKYVIQQSRTNLTKGKKNSSKALYNSLGYNIKETSKGVNIEFLMDEYGAYQDKGVSGKKKKYNTPFSYKDKMPPSSALDKWTVRKGYSS